MKKFNFNDKYSYLAAVNLKTDKQIQNAIDLKKAGFIDEFSYKGALYLNGDIDNGQIKNAINLKRNGFMDKFSYEEALKLKKEIDSVRLKNAIKLKQAKFSDTFSYNIAELGDDITSQKIINAINLRRAGINDKFCYMIANELDGDINSGRVKNAIDLIKAGFNSEASYNFANELTGNIDNGEIKNAIDLVKTTGLDAKTIYLGLSNNINNQDQLKTLEELLPYFYNDQAIKLATEITRDQIQTVISIKQNSVRYDFPFSYELVKMVLSLDPNLVNIQKVITLLNSKINVEDAIKRSKIKLTNN